MSKEHLRVLMIAPTPFFADRGCHVRILGETKALLRRGHEVVICTYHHGQDVSGIETRRIATIPWYQKLAAGPSWHKLYLDFFLLIRSFFSALKFKPDIIHAHLHEGVFIGKLLSVVLRKPLIFDYQGSLTAESVDHGFFEDGSCLSRIASFIEKRLNFWADVVISSAPQDIGVENLRVLYDGVDTAIFRPRAADADLRRSLGISAQAKVVAYLGILGEYQGTDVLLCAAQKVIAEIPEAVFLIMGYPHVGEYQQLSEELGIAENTVFTGRVAYEDASAYLSLGQVAVAPKNSKSEANQKILSYMACGLPTVAFDTVVNREMLGGVGILVPLGDEAALAQALVQVLRSETLQSNLAKATRRRVEELFSWDGVGEKLEGIYRELLNE